MIFGPLTGGSVEPGPLVRPRADRELLGRHLAVHRRPARRRAPGGVALPLRDRRPAVRARPGAAHQSGRRGRARRRGRRDRRPRRTRAKRGRIAPCASVPACGGSPSRATTRSRCRGPAAATASTARSRRTRPHLYAPEEVEARLDEAVRRNAKELLVLTGEAPEVNPEVAERLRSVRPRRLRRLRRLGLRAGARARPAAAHEPRRPGARRTWPGCARSPPRRG